MSVFGRPEDLVQPAEPAGSEGELDFDVTQESVTDQDVSRSISGHNREAPGSNDIENLTQSKENQPALFDEDDESDDSFVSDRDIKAQNQRWRDYTRSEREVARSVRSEVGRNLSARLLRAHHRLAKQYCEISKELDFTRLPRQAWVDKPVVPVRWTRWPDDPATVPRRISTVWQDSIVKQERWRPGQELEDGIFGVLLKRARRQWNERADHDAQTPDTNDGDSSESEIVEGVDRNDQASSHKPSVLAGPTPVENERAAVGTNLQFANQLDSSEPSKSVTTTANSRAQSSGQSQERQNGNSTLPIPPMSGPHTSISELLAHALETGIKPADALKAHVQMTMERELAKRRIEVSNKRKREEEEEELVLPEGMTSQVNVPGTFINTATTGVLPFHYATSNYTDPRRPPVMPTFPGRPGLQSVRASPIPLQVLVPSRPPEKKRKLQASAPTEAPASASPPPTAKEKEPTLDPDDASQNKEPPDRPTFSVDDERSRKILNPIIKSTITQIDQLLISLLKSSQSANRTQVGRRRRSSSRGGNTTDASTGFDPDVSRTTKFSGARKRSAKSRTGQRKGAIRPQDWTNLLGMAAMLGTDEAVLSRAAVRCSRLLGESMEFHHLPVPRHADRHRDKRVRFAPTDETDGSPFLETPSSQEDRDSSDNEGSALEFGVHNDGFLMPIDFDELERFRNLPPADGDGQVASDADADAREAAIALVPENGYEDRVEGAEEDDDDDVMMSGALVQ